MLVPAVFDGYIGLDSSATCTLDSNNRAVAGTYDAIDVIEHEIPHVMGRQMFEGEPRPDGAASGYSPHDFFRYLVLGDLTYAEGAGYFLLDDTQMLLPFNDPPRVQMPMAGVCYFATGVPDASVFYVRSKNGALGLNSRLSN